MSATVRLDEVCSIIMGQAPKGSAYNTSGEGWPLIAGAGDFRNGLPAPNKYTTEASKLSRAGDIVLGIRASIGAKVLSDGEYCLGRGVAALRAGANVDSRFLWNWLTFNASKLAAKGKGATFKQVNREDIGQMPFPIIALQDQRRIAQLLDHIEILRAKRRQALSLIDDLAQSAFLDMFGDPRDNPNGWPMDSLANLADSDDRINYGVIQPGDNVSGGVPLVRVGDLRDGYVDRSAIKTIDPAIEAKYARSRLKGNEILVGCVGSIGSVALVADSDIGSNIARAVARIPISSNPLREYTAEYLRTTSVQRYFTGELRTVAQPTLNIKQLAETAVMIPPTKLQEDFALRIAAIRKHKQVHLRHLTLVDTLFTSLEYRAFHGELSANEIALAGKGAPV
ncbi:restriction endonuclease subunit S [Streptomyces chrestomyceticus]|uniref:restriction endonuclease subunit S n=1 Tax=Streptomyces chrestomyceticus TaxID=68185 RepID=UPI0033DC91DE